MRFEAEIEVQTCFKDRHEEKDYLSNSQKEDEGPSVCNILLLELS